VANFFQLINKDETMADISRATFEPLSGDAERLLDCELYKDDKNFLQKIFGKSKKVKRHEFGQKKKGLFKKLFNGNS
jgi:hypothetical protein